MARTTRPTRPARIALAGAALSLSLSACGGAPAPVTDVVPNCGPFPEVANFECYASATEDHGAYYLSAPPRGTAWQDLRSVYAERERVPAGDVVDRGYFDGRWTVPASDD